VLSIPYCRRVGVCDVVKFEYWVPAAIRSVVGDRRGKG
jgi:hypothetical protein